MNEPDASPGKDANPSGAQWQPVASSWEDWEHLGLNMTSVQPFLPAVRSPVLVIGAGQGMVMEGLRDAGYEVAGVDCLAAMALEAERRRGLQVHVALGQDLPFDAASFNAVVVPTGVLDMGGVEIARAVVRDVRRVLRAAGVLIAGWWVTPPNVVRVYEALGVIEGGLWLGPRLLDVWSADRDEQRWGAQIAAWRHLSEGEGIALAQRYRALLCATFADVERMALSVRAKGQDVTAVLGEVCSDVIPILTREGVLELLRTEGFAPLETHWEPEMSTFTVMGRRS